MLNIALHIQLDAECDHQATSVGRYLKALCYSDRQLSVVSTYVYGKVEIPLVRFVVDIRYIQVRNKSTTNRTDRL